MIMAIATTTEAWIRWFEKIGIEDVPLVGGKNASLGEMYRELASQGVNVPNGFAITAHAYWEFLREAGLEATILDALKDLDARDLENLRRRGRRIRQAMLAASLPRALERAILEAYARLSEGAREPVDVAVRSSATAEDLPDASFAGQQETYLNVQGPLALLDTCKRCFACCLPIARSRTGLRKDSTTGRSRFPSEFNAWCARIWLQPGSCFPSIPRRDSGTRS